MRQEYVRAGLSEHDLAPDWPAQFACWLADATAAGLPEPNAMVLGSADDAGRPSARTVLLKHVDASGLVWYTNYGSRKAIELAANPYASALFPWHGIGRQVIFYGRVTRLPEPESARYFATRPRMAQLGAWASPQSQVVADRAELERLLAQAELRFAGMQVPAPPHWGGLRLTPDSVEFWQGRQGRLHDRLCYRRTDAGAWLIQRLAP
jgi:pyridoxamine 5'-phosphate oxidase